MRPDRKLRPYRDGDAAAILNPREDSAREYAAMGFPFDRERPPGLAWTLLRDGRPCGIGGAVPVAPGVWRMWAFVSRDWPGADFAFAAECVRGVIRLLEDVLTAERIECWVAVNSTKARRFALGVGFREGDQGDAPEGFLTFVRD